MFQSPVVPLYLGADLFSNTDIRTENHPRHHAKFAKKGLATKINFSSGKIQNKNTLNNNIYTHNTPVFTLIFHALKLQTLKWPFIVTS